MKLILKKIKGKISKKTYIDKLQEKGMVVGKNFNLYDSYIDYSHCFLVEIGDDVTITHSTILCHDASTKSIVGKSKVGKVKIGSRVFIGWNSIILPGVTIGDDVIIGAGTVVSKDIPKDSIVVGNPCKIIGKKSEFEKKHKKLILNKPVYNTYWSNKDLKEINDMKNALEYTFGYDE